MLQTGLTQESQIITCANGKTSNESHHAVKLTPSQNRFSLVCGSEGEILPTKYQDTYFVSKDGEGSAAQTCSGNYTEVIPVYESKWWQTNGDNTTFTLVIPEDGFPEEETKIVVGCQKKPTQCLTVRGAAGKDSPTVCTSDVMIEGVASSSVGVVGVFPWTVGFAATSSAFCIFVMT